MQNIWPKNISYYSSTLQYHQAFYSNVHLRFTLLRVHSIQKLIKHWKVDLRRKWRYRETTPIRNRMALLKFSCLQKFISFNFNKTIRYHVEDKIQHCQWVSFTSCYCYFCYFWVYLGKSPTDLKFSLELLFFFFGLSLVFYRRCWIYYFSCFNNFFSHFLFIFGTYLEQKRLKISLVERA